MAGRGLVLAGGGSRGAYQIGVWQALRELGEEFQIVAGTSVGALNGAMYAQGDFDRALALWSSLYTGDIVALPEDFPKTVDYNKPGWEAEVWAPLLRQALESGGADFGPLEKILRENVNEERVRQSPVRFGLVTVEYPSMKPAELSEEQIPQGKLLDFLSGSAACFPAFRTKQIDGARYIDGGYHDNIPVNLAVRMGAEEIFAVDLDCIGKERRVRDRSVEVERLESYWDLGPFLWFEPECSRRNMRLGYLDTLKKFGAAEGWAYTLEKGGTVELVKNLAGRLLPFERDILRTRPCGLWEYGARNRLLRCLRQKRRGVHLDERLCLAVCETAAEYIGADPRQLYTGESFPEALRQAWRKMDSMEDHPDGWLAVTVMRKEIREAGREPDAGFWNQVMMLPEAFLTAAVLELCGA